jgi:hypothetical protein
VTPLGIVNAVPRVLIGAHSDNDNASSSNDTAASATETATT